jgi:hypothetical protein
VLIRFEIDDTKYEYDADTYPLFEARLIKSLTGLNAGAYLRGLGEMDEEAICGMVYLAKRRAGEDVEWDQLGQMDLMPLIQSIGDNAVEAEADRAVEHFEQAAEPAGVSDVEPSVDAV